MRNLFNKLNSNKIKEITNKKDSKGKTPLEYAQTEQVALQLIRWGAKANPTQLEPSCLGFMSSEDPLLSLYKNAAKLGWDQFLIQSLKFDKNPNLTSDIIYQLLCTIRSNGFALYSPEVLSFLFSNKNACFRFQSSKIWGCLPIAEELCRAGHYNSAKQLVKNTWNCPHSFYTHALNPLFLIKTEEKEDYSLLSKILERSKEHKLDLKSFTKPVGTTSLLQNLWEKECNNSENIQRQQLIKAGFPYISPEQTEILDWKKLPNRLFLEELLLSLPDKKLFLYSLLEKNLVTEWCLWPLFDSEKDCDFLNEIRKLKLIDKYLDEENNLTYRICFEGLTEALVDPSHSRQLKAKQSIKRIFFNLPVEYVTLIADHSELAFRFLEEFMAMPYSLKFYFIKFYFLDPFQENHRSLKELEEQLKFLCYQQSNSEKIKEEAIQLLHDWSCSERQAVTKIYWQKKFITSIQNHPEWQIENFVTKKEFDTFKNEVKNRLKRWQSGFVQLAQLIHCSGGISTSQLPKEFTCPISLEIMEKPVLLLADSFIYEKEIVENLIDCPHNRSRKIRKEEIIPHDTLSEVIKILFQDKNI